MKLPQLLSQFLYQTRKLDLPGIGSFTLDADVVIPQESDRVGQMPATGIHFTNANITTPDDTLVNFIKTHTGKMKSLSASDLDFFLTTGRQLLNIGKPFHLDGIGTLMQTKDGKLDFTPGEYMVGRLENSSPERKTGYEDLPKDREAPSTSVRQMLILVGIVGGLIVIGWGGYYLYQRNNYTEPSPEKQAVVIPETARKDSGVVARHGSADTTAAVSKVATPQPEGAKVIARPPVPVVTGPSEAIPVLQGQNLYRFVILATANKYHALKRYNQLLGYQLNIKMDQKDSSYFKLYFSIASAPRDTAQIKDSLADVYAAPHVFIERRP